ncbi:ribonuclease P protein component [Jiella sp. M17.18]|uniref:ribonuclease P protein component n=1 Tax=Jiella sp. M17.18 TaxID=3234247 RepID=UPI0034DF4128
MAAGKLKKRAEFLAARKGRRLNGPFFFIEALDRGDDGPPRVGLTVTRKVGNAVVRNRIRRRLREAIRLFGAAGMERGLDYVVVARREVYDVPFDVLSDEISRRILRTRKPEPDLAGMKRRPKERRSGSD